MHEIDPAALDARLQDDTGDTLVVDVRDQDAYRDWHVPRSRNVPVSEDLSDDPDELPASLRELPDDREIVTVCGVGEMAAEATQLLRAEGYEARTLRDGMRGWSRVHRTAPVDADLDGTLVQVARPGTGCLSHVLVSDGRAAVFDPSSFLEVYEDVLAAHDADLVGVFDTHAHADHVSGGPRLADRHDVPYYRHPADADGIEVSPLSDGRALDVGRVGIEVIHTPGHSPGSVSFGLDGEALLTGDTLFFETVGRVELGVAADLEDADVAENAAALYDGLQRLRDYGDDPLVLPAHDPGSPDPPVSARMSEVVERNDGLGRDRGDFVDTLAGDVPDQPPNFERIKRVNVGAESVPAEEVPALEAGPNNCAAE